MNLKDYLPNHIYDDVVDMQELMSTEQTVFDDLTVELQNAIKETYVSEASNFGVSKWEGMLNIKPSTSHSLDDRRKVVETKLFVRNKATFIFLNSVVSAYGTIENITFNSATSTVSVNFVGGTTSTQLYLKVREIIPAHLLIEYVFTTSSEIIGLQENIYSTDITRNTLLGAWTLGNTSFATPSEEVQYK